jgi:hypothetical protein
MADQQKTDAPSRFTLAIDMRDVLAGAGVIVVLAGAAVIHWGLALLVLGGALIATAWRLTK